MVRAGIERLLFFVLGAARGLFILQGVAFGGAAVAAGAAAPEQMPAWFRDALVSAVEISATFFVAGLLLIAARRWRVGVAASAPLPAWPWKLVLGLSLLGLPLVAIVAAADLPALWSRIAVHLAAMGFWDATASQAQHSGLVMLPVLMALFVPALVTTAAVWSILFPVAVCPLLVSRSRAFPTLLAMGVTCQVALVLNGWIASGAFARLAMQVTATMVASGDAEVLRVADDLGREAALLTRTAIALAAPGLGMLAWFTFLRPSGSTATYFSEGGGGR